MKIQCPYSDCSQLIQIETSVAGKQASCPTCGRPFICPSLEEFPRQERLLGSSLRVEEVNAATTSPGSAIRDRSPERIKRLWEEATKLGRTDVERLQAIGIYTELLTIIESGIDGTYKLNDETCDVCPIFRNRAIAHRGLKNYPAALEDLARELEIAQRRVVAAGKQPADVILADEMRVLKCQQLIAETRDRQRVFAP